MTRKEHHTETAQRHGAEKHTENVLRETLMADRMFDTTEEYVD